MNSEGGAVQQPLSRVAEQAAKRVALDKLTDCPHCGSKALGATEPTRAAFIEVTPWRTCGDCGNNIYLN